MTTMFKSLVKLLSGALYRFCTKFRKGELPLGRIIGIDIGGSTTKIVGFDNRKYLVL